MKQHGAGWIKWQRGQALTEYSVLVPAGIFIMLMAGLVVQFIVGGFEKTVQGLNPATGLECEVEPEAKQEGPEVAPLGCHSVQLVGRSYDEANDRTTAAYQVTSACDPSISHWTLGLPAELRGNVVRVSEQYEWGTDATTGVAGIKFDTGYETGGGGDKDTEVDPVVPPGRDKDKDKDKKSAADGYALTSFSSVPLVPYYQTDTSDSRTVIITLAGYYQWDVVTVGLKAGTELYYSEITAPVQPDDGSSEETNQCPE